MQKADVDQIMPMLPHTGIRALTTILGVIVVTELVRAVLSAHALADGVVAGNFRVTASIPKLILNA